MFGFGMAAPTEFSVSWYLTPALWLTLAAGTLGSAPLVPWFAWCLLPLVLANVLVANLLARERFAIVPWLVLAALGYGLALGVLKPRLPAMEQLRAFRSVVQTLGSFSLLLFGVAAWFTWRDKAQSRASSVRI